MNNRDKTISVDKSEAVANVFTMKCLLTMTLIIGLTVVLNILGIFIVEDRLMYISFGSGVVCSILTALVVKFFNHKEIAKYIVIFLMVIFVTLIGVMLTYHTLLICTMPILCASQYKKKFVVYFTYIISVISMFLIVMLGYYYGLCDANMLALTNTTASNYVDEATGELIFGGANTNPWATLPLYFVFPRSLVMFAFVPVMKHVSDVISSNAVREEKLRKLSEVDTMTQLYNKNKYTQMLSDYYLNCEEVGVIFWDVNDLKVVNDTMGHDYGDYLISSIASSILENMGESAMAYRVGGDEFVVVVEETSEKQLQEIVSKTQESIALKNKVSKVNLSAAVGFAMGEGNDIEKVIANADSNMYVDKQRYHRENN